MRCRESKTKWKRTQSPALCRKKELSSWTLCSQPSPRSQPQSALVFLMSPKTCNLIKITVKVRLKCNTQPPCPLFHSLPSDAAYLRNEIKRNSENVKVTQQMWQQPFPPQTDLFFFLIDLVPLNKTRLKSSHRARCFLPAVERNELRDRLLVILWRTRTQPSSEAGCGGGREAQQFHLRHSASVPEHVQK